MDERIKFFVGLDVHGDSIAMSVCEAGREPGRFVSTLTPDVQALLKTLSKYGAARQVSVVYEAGPTGYGLYRALIDRGYRCEIIAPSLTPRRPGERIKTDRRDSLRLAELSRAGELKAIWVPDQAHEALRNLWRAREDAVNLRLQARQQLKAFLLRQGRRYPGKTSWNKTHQRWIAEQHFDHPADYIALAEYQLAVQAAQDRVQRLTTALEHAIEGWRQEPTVAALRALRGIDTVSAIGLVCEIGDIARFGSARQLMGYLGLVPSEHSSGNSVRRGSITKTGNAHARRLLTEAAWNYRFPARMSQALRDRSATLSPGIRTHAWKAQVRLCSRFAHLSARGVQANKVCVAVARELTGFIWAIARQSLPDNTHQ
ncbi:IS110 family transposase ISCARN28 [Achromobacter animicus]|uniref:IS110 family transposase n=1 Tax=Achromobacter animicus TaxID=1389935 RepID=UPI001465122D|nr:IS110 family transposase [Achromobacter animicus]CAB3819378.1 IS110 family transposase ISCARN28 [Achromobacter animicus]